MRVKVKKVGTGNHPSELLVSVSTKAGEERLFVHNRSIKDNDTLDIGHPIQESADGYLVELPRETLKGEWRVWVARELVAA